jgi:hypothetical protein
VPVATFGDLNRVSERELQRAKDAMSMNFDRNRVLPGDPQYEWDKRADFAPDEPSEWDDDGEDFDS